MAQKHKAAFSMIEVMIAVSIFAVAMTVFSQIAFNTVESRHALHERSDLSADMRFVRRHILSIDDPDEMEDGDEIDTLSSGEAQWEVEIEETNMVSLAKLIITITMTDPKTDEEKIYITEAYVLRPNLVDQKDDQILLQEKKSAILANRPADFVL